MHWSTVPAVALGAFLQYASAVPTQKHIVVDTTQHNGQTIDWVLKSSQGKIASPPPLPNLQSRANSDPRIKQAFPNLPPAGPPGTVPVLRSNFTYPPKRAPRASDHNNTSAIEHQKRQYSGVHWYASSNEVVDNHGGGCAVNIWDAYVQSSSDFNLLQIAVVRDNVPDGKSSQTVEAGWQHYGQIGGDQPYLFTYYTTVGYASSGDNVGGYNQAQQGWVQTDSSLYPGIHITPLSTFGGAQYEFTLQYQLYEGNWWLYIIDRFIGYYPGSLFSAGTTASASLADHSSDILFYGEIYNSENAETTTDMGSGNFAAAGSGQAAYMRNIGYIDTNGNLNDYNSHGAFVISDTSRYTLQDSFQSGTTWGSYMYLGGPGAGGVTGG